MPLEAWIVLHPPPCSHDADAQLPKSSNIVLDIRPSMCLIRNCQSRLRGAAALDLTTCASTLDSSLLEPLLVLPPLLLLARRLLHRGRRTSLTLRAPTLALCGRLRLCHGDNTPPWRKDDVNVVPRPWTSSFLCLPLAIR